MNALDNALHTLARVGANILEQHAIARRARGFLGAVLLALLAFLPGLAAADPASVGTLVGGDRINLFEAHAVPVDATAGNTTEAREKAFVEGRVAALRVVVERIANRDQLAKLPQLSSAQVIDMVREFSVANEKSSAVRYLADLTVRFDADAVRRLLRDAGIQFSESVSRPMVLLPVYDTGGTAMLWEAANPWRNAFANLSAVDGLVPLILPLGDAQDAQVTLSEIFAHDSTALAILTTRYNAGGVVIARATGGAQIKVTLTEVRGIAPPVETTISVTPAADQTSDAAFAVAAANAIQTLSESWKRQSRFGARDTIQITALATLHSLKDWIDIRNGLRNVPSIERMEIQAMTRDRAQLSLRYRGDAAAFALALAQQGLEGHQQGNVWIIGLPGQAVIQ